MSFIDNILIALGLKEEELKSYKPNPLPVDSQITVDGEKKHFVTIRPKTFKDIERAVDFLVNNECSIIDMSSIRAEESTRIIDFLSGSCYALKAQLKRLQGDLFLLMPSSIKLNNLE